MTSQRFFTLEAISDTPDVSTRFIEQRVAGHVLSGNATAGECLYSGWDHLNHT